MSDHCPNPDLRKKYLPMVLFIALDFNNEHFIHKYIVKYVIFEINFFFSIFCQENMNRFTHLYWNYKTVCFCTVGNILNFTFQHCFQIVP